MPEIDRDTIDIACTIFKIYLTPVSQGIRAFFPTLVAEMLHVSGSPIGIAAKGVPNVADFSDLFIGAGYS